MICWAVTPMRSLAPLRRPSARAVRPEKMSDAVRANYAPPNAARDKREERPRRPAGQHVTRNNPHRLPHAGKARIRRGHGGAQLASTAGRHTTQRDRGQQSNSPT